MNKPRSDSKLQILPADQQAALTQWLLDGLPYTTIKARLQTDFAIECSAMAISRYWRKNVQPVLAQRRAHLVDLAQHVEKENRDHPHTADLIVADRLESRL